MKKAKTGKSLSKVSEVNRQARRADTSTFSIRCVEKVPERGHVASPQEPTLNLSDHASDDRTQLIAFYLPQFHPIPENDEAWGRGFTEWTNVTKAAPLYEGHHQPQLPGELGFYDLRVPEVMEQQAKLAKAYGISGFCHYYYWFDGRRLLERPLELMLSNKSLEMPFCLCWANENWTRRWDGSEHEVLVSQNFTPGSWERKFIEDLYPYFSDNRYIRIDGRPLLLVYRPNAIPDLGRCIRIWREIAKENELELFIAACLTFGFDDPFGFGFDAGVEFPPHGVLANEVNDKIEWKKPFDGRAYYYADVVTTELVKWEKPYKTFRTAMAGWDNTSRLGARGHLYHGATPELFETWLSALVIHSKRRHRPGQRLVFINAWNEWAEGAHLEPDRQFGRRWLAACARAAKASLITTKQDIEAEVIKRFEARAASEVWDPPAINLLEMLLASTERCRSLQAVNLALSKFYLNWLETSSFNRASPIVSAGLSEVAHGVFPVVGFIDVPSKSTVHVNRGDPWYISGWICPVQPIEATQLTCIVSLVRVGSDSNPLFSLATYHIGRPDVLNHKKQLPVEVARVSGFQAYIDLRTIGSGEYTVLVGLRANDQGGVSYMEMTRRLFLS